MDNDTQLNYTTFGGVESKKKVQGNSVRIDIITEVWMAGNFLFFAIVLREEGSATYWCPYCSNSCLEWKETGKQMGETWMIDSLIKHYKELEERSQLVAPRFGSIQKGVVTLPLFDS